VVLYGATGKVYRFQVRIDVPKAFPAPDAHPDVWLLESPFAFTDDAHVDSTGNVCLEMREAHELNYERIGLVGILDQVVFHIDRLRIHALTGRYPGPEYGHGDDGVRQFLKEKHAEFTSKLPPGVAHATLPGVPLPPDRQRCPCGSGLRFAKCHKETVRRIRREMRLAGVMPKREFVHHARNPFRRR
jgi:hypothetical protein